MESQRKPPPAHPPRTSKGTDPDRALLALLFFALLAIGCFFLAQRLRRDAAIQDCVMAGHRNCDPDGPPAPDR